MHETPSWFLDAKTTSIVLAMWGFAVILHALWRSRGAAPVDPIRESGPIV